MDIIFTCESCGQSVVIDGAAAGQPVDCPKCRTPLEVPYKSKPLVKAPTPSPAEPSAQEWRRSSPVLVTLVVVLGLLLAGASSMLFVSTRRSKSVEAENSQLRGKAAELERRVAAITGQTKAEQRLTYQGVSLTEWIKLTDDSEGETRERAWKALSWICVEADSDMRSKVLSPLLSPLVKKPLAGAPGYPEVRWYAAVCNRFLNDDEETLDEIAEWIAVETGAKKDVRREALGWLDTLPHDDPKSTERKVQTLTRIVKELSQREYQTDEDSYILSNAKFTLGRFPKQE
jgi:hypothetical protein